MKVKKKKKNISIKIIKSKVKIIYFQKKKLKKIRIDRVKALVEVIIYLQNINTKKIKDK
jgi:hypothetical protein